MLAVPTDVGQSDDLTRLVESAIRERGTIDILVNNAGIEAFSHYEELARERIEETIRVNLTSAPPAHSARRAAHAHRTAGTRGEYVVDRRQIWAGLWRRLCGDQSRPHRLHAGAAGRVSRPWDFGFGDLSRFHRRRGHLRPHEDAVGPEVAPTCRFDDGRRVARAVVRAIEKDRPEVIVNWPPLRPTMVFAEMFPSLGAAAIRAATIRFLKRVAESRNDQTLRIALSAVFRVSKVIHESLDLHDPQHFGHLGRDLAEGGLPARDSGTVRRAR